MQINRLFEMVYLLLNKKSMTAGELATHFEVSPRTIYRDVELLSSAGIPIYMTKGKGGGISLLPDFVLNKTVLTDGEKSDMNTTIDHVTDFTQIAAYGVMTTPALVVDGKVVSFGKALKKDEVVKILQKVRG